MSHIWLKEGHKFWLLKHEPLILSGCRDDAHCPSGYKCDSHYCMAVSGLHLLRSVEVKSISCEACDKEGLKLTLQGNNHTSDVISCETNLLEHNNEVDFDAGTAVFDKESTLGFYDTNGGCLNVAEAF